MKRERGIVNLDGGLCSVNDASIIDREMKLEMMIGINADKRVANSVNKSPYQEPIVCGVE